MNHENVTRLATAAVPAVLAGSAAVAAETPKVDPAELDRAFEALEAFDWGADHKVFNPIDRAVLATQDDAEGRKALETRLAAVLGGGASRAAKDYVCRALRTIGTAASVPALAALLSDAEVSHLARYALERILVPEAGAALREALPKVDGARKAGVIGSLGARRDAASVASLVGLLNDVALTDAAAAALGNIGTPEAAKALTAAAKDVFDPGKPAVTDGCFRCAERLMADGKRAEAVAVYKAFTGEDQPRHVRLAATRGLLGGAAN